MSWRHAAIALARLTIRDIRDDRIVGVAAQVAFFALLAIPPLLLALAGTAGYIDSLFGPHVADGARAWLMRGLGGFLTPRTMEDLVAPTVDSIFAEGRGGILSVGAVLALWSSSRLVRVLIEAMNVAYDVPEWRPAWKRRLIAIGLTIGGIFVITAFLPIIVAGPRLGQALDDRFGLGGIVGAIWLVVYWPAAATIGVALLATLYHFAPNWQTRWRRDLPGALLAAAGWLVGAVALRVYARYTVSEQEVGPLAAPLVLLLWFYISSFVVLVGAELNAEVEKMWPTKRAGPREPNP